MSRPASTKPPTAIPRATGPTSESPMAVLKEATRVLHQETEDRPFSVALAAGRLTLRQYALHLYGHFELHRDLEDALARSRDPRVRMVSHPGLAKTPLLEADLRALGFDVRDVPAPVCDAIERELRLGELDGPALLGRLYVFEGSTLGGAVLRRRLRDAVAPIPAAAMSYYGCYGEELGLRWRDFCGRMTAALTHPDEVGAAVDGAADAFAGVGRVFDAVWAVTTTAADEGANASPGADDARAA